MFKVGITRILKIYNGLLLSEEEGGLGLSNEDIYVSISDICKELNVCRTVELLKDYFFLMVQDEVNCDEVTKSLRRIYKNTKNVPEIKVLMDLKNILDKVVCFSEHPNPELKTDNSVLNKYMSAITFIYFINYFVATYIKPNAKMLNKRFKDSVFNDCGDLFKSYIRSCPYYIQKNFISTLVDLCDGGAEDFSIKVHGELAFSFQLNLIIFYKLVESTLDSDVINFYLKNASLGQYLSSYVISDLESKESYCCLVDKFVSLFRRRKFLIPYNGVEIVCDNLTFTVFERQFEDCNYLIILPSDKSELIAPLAINLNTGGVLGSSHCLYDVLNVLFYFYELDSKCDGLMLPKDPLLYNSFNFYDACSEVRTIKGTDYMFKSFEVRVPYYWNYRNSNKNSSDKESSFRSDFYGEETIQISAFTRKLPKGYTASDEAKELAKKYCLDLEEGETVVSPFSKNIKIKIK